MLQGPAEDGGVGFAATWREPVDLADLPWAHLLVGDQRPV
jgi:hypothetical protein